MKARTLRVLVGLAGAALSCLAPAQQDPQKEIERYRQMLQDGNPSELFEARGAEHWKARRGPKGASLEQCDLGLGAGVVRGAYVQLPRYFADTDKVQDLESRLVTCMVEIQGFTADEAARHPFSGSGRPSVMADLVAWIASESRGMKIAAPRSHPKERLAYRAGEKIFFYRAGPHDFACATCHGQDDKRIRLQDLPNLTNPRDAQRAFGTWPAYRVSQGEVRSMQWRLYDCFRQQRFPEIEFASDASIALIAYLAGKAEGGTFDAPAIKR
jgi:L-cysteine S-thiosulfotransferase